jgi:hypothetical protein
MRHLVEDHYNNYAIIELYVDLSSFHSQLRVVDLSNDNTFDY